MQLPLLFISNLKAQFPYGRERQLIKGEQLRIVRIVGEQSANSANSRRIVRIVGEQSANSANSANSQRLVDEQCEQSTNRANSRRIVGEYRIPLSPFSARRICSHEETKKQERFLLVRGKFFRQPILTNHVAGQLIKGEWLRIVQTVSEQTTNSANRVLYITFYNNYCTLRCVALCFLILVLGVLRLRTRSLKLGSHLSEELG